MSFVDPSFEYDFNRFSLNSLGLDQRLSSYRYALVRCDLNVPMHNGGILDTSRIEHAKETLTRIIELGIMPIVISHFGRPLKEEQAEVNVSLKSSSSDTRSPFSLQFISPTCEKIWGKKVIFVESDKYLPNGLSSSGLTPLISLPQEILVSSTMVTEVDRYNEKNFENIELIRQKIHELYKENKTELPIILLENIRFYPEEEKNDALFAQKFSSLGDVYINEAFSCAHRPHASIVGFPNYLPSYMGLGLEKELKAIELIKKTPKESCFAIVGGSKISTKLPVLETLLSHCEKIAVVGAMANTFLKAKGQPVGESLYEADYVNVASCLLETYKDRLFVPFSFRCRSRRGDVQPKELPGNDSLLDVGTSSVQKIMDLARSAGTVFFNGPLGRYEEAPFDQGTQALLSGLKELCAQGTKVILGGGDTLAVLHRMKHQFKSLTPFTHVSTGGGAFLEALHELKGGAMFCHSRT